MPTCPNCDTPPPPAIQPALDSHGDSSWKRLSPGFYREQLRPCGSLPCLQRRRSRKARRKKPEFSGRPGLRLWVGVPIPIHAEPGGSLTHQQLPASSGSSPGSRGGVGESPADRTKRGPAASSKNNPALPRPPLVPKWHIHAALNPSGDVTPPVPGLDLPFREEIFPDIQPTPPLVLLELFPCSGGVEHFTPPSIWGHHTWDQSPKHPRVSAMSLDPHSCFPTAPLTCISLLRKRSASRRWELLPCGTHGRPCHKLSPK